MEEDKDKETQWRSKKKRERERERERDMNAARNNINENGIKERFQVKQRSESMKSRKELLETTDRRKEMHEEKKRCIF